ncbi:hypothetical protein Tco_1221065 [Tanacetum coccineum]
MEHDIENMTMNEYLEYEAKMERRLRKSARSKRNPTIYEEANFNSFHQDKSSAFDYPYYHEDIEINKYHGLPPLHPCFELDQPYIEDGLLSSNMSNEVYIDSITIAEYELYIAKQCLKKDPLNDHSYSQNGSRKPQEKQEKAKVDDYDEGNMDNIWDITVEDVERLRKLLTPTIHILPEPDHVVKPYVPLILLPNELKVVREEESDNVVVAFDLLRDALSAIFGLSELKEINRHGMPGMHWVYHFGLACYKDLDNESSDDDNDDDDVEKDEEDEEEEEHLASADPSAVPIMMIPARLQLRIQRPKSETDESTSTSPTLIQQSYISSTDIQEKNKKKAKSKQIRARNGKDKVKSQAK